MSSESFSLPPRLSGFNPRWALSCHGPQKLQDLVLLFKKPHSQNPRADSHWTNSSHMFIPEPIMVAEVIEHVHWLDQVPFL